MELKPCPFCQSTSLHTPTYDVQPDGIWQGHVECGNCEARGPNAFWYENDEGAENAAVAAWNAMTIAASQPAQESAQGEFANVCKSAICANSQPAQGEPSVQPTLLNESCDSPALLKPAHEPSQLRLAQAKHLLWQWQAGELLDAAYSEQLAMLLSQPAQGECKPDAYVMHPIRTCPKGGFACTCGPAMCKAAPGQ